MDGRPLKNIGTAIRLPLLEVVMGSLIEIL